MFTIKFLKDAAERVVSTFAQALLGAIAGDAVTAVALPFPSKLAIAGMAALASLLKALAASTIGTPDDASLLPADGPGDA